MHTYKNINFTKNITQIQIIDRVTRESILRASRDARTREAKNEDKGMVSREKITRGNRLLNVASV